MRGHTGPILALLLLAAASCGKSEDTSHGQVCVDGDARCGAACNSKLPCAQGLYCAADGRCAKECVASKTSARDGACGRGEQCGGDGMCVRAEDDHQTMTEIPGGQPGSTGSGGASPLRDGGPTPDAGDGTTCAATTVRTTRVMPTVILIVDQSGSMTQGFGGSTRWNALRDFLLSKPDGLIADLQKQVRFGLSMYSARSDQGGSGPNPVGECPIVTTVEPAFDNFDAIAAAYRAAEPIEDTPTGDSIDKIVDTLGLDETDPDVNANPVVFVLATDGEPDRCEELDPQTDTARQESVAAVKRAFELGIRTYVISVGNEVGEDHQQEIANAGLGHMAGEPDAEYWTAGDDASLRDALTSIVSSQLSCKIALNGSVADGTECDGTVTLNGGDLECNGKNGWKLVDPKHIELVGDACDDLKSSADVLLDVTFPCSFQVD
jgi:hypothetical protein